MEHFKELQKHLDETKNSDESVYDGTELEIAYEVNTEQQTITPGVHIIADSFDQPLFFSVGELRDMADKAEEKVKQLMKNQS